LELMTHEAEDVLQKEELRPVELHIRQHVAHQGVPASANVGCIKSKTALRHSGPTWGHLPPIDEDETRPSGENITLTYGVPVRMTETLTWRTYGRIQE
jgi:hypothetical protein